MAPKLSPKPIRFRFPDSDLEKLQRQLDDTLLPEEELVEDAGWKYGTDLSKLKQLVEDWKRGDAVDAFGKNTGPGGGVSAWWRKVEERINRYPHYIAEIEGVQVHYQVARSPETDAIPLIFSHGWPGSFFEADLLLDKLTRPDVSGRSFHVVVPSLIGYGLSGKPPKQGWSLEDTARLFDKLMTEVLGFQTYAAHGGDWGYTITRLLARYDACTAYHTNFLVPNIPTYALPVMGLAKMGYSSITDRLLPYIFDARDVNLLKRGLEYMSVGSGYYQIQATKPATVGYALYDSPVGILSYLLEKFREWSDRRAPAFQPAGQGEQSSGMTDENILISATIYYLTKSTHTSFLPYYESGYLFDKFAKDRTFTAPARKKPFGHSRFPWELAGSPKPWIGRLDVNLKSLKEHDYGGHFAALDNPNALSSDLREFFTAHF
ncbi:alpha/beta-hydrolase [Ceraceosorus guamensis]|uniref:Alpha/beta-hydrolase n=1 Tax=Ceraceosorus guamensis TaxID=1522189 RepID=A0A316VVH0_9BASI|nr:alpha/beta-hydrolase [Ceraceosorus guamensis]PWN40938.1 alpha/beta-hydrolase [Ceraceosorus guamensis]